MSSQSQILSTKNRITNTIISTNVIRYFIYLLVLTVKISSKPKDIYSTNVLKSVTGYHVKNLIHLKILPVWLCNSLFHL